jgi:AcrR family transcriptional regulator
VVGRRTRIGSLKLLLRGCDLKTGKPRVTKQRVADVAVECFTQYGVHRTSMSDIADKMGVARQTIYRLFESRLELLEFIATDRMRTLAENLNKDLIRCASLEESFEESMVLSLKLGRADTLLEEIIHQGGDAQFHKFKFGGTEQVLSLMLEFYGPLIQQARAQGRLNREISDKEAVEWISNVGAVLNLREDYDEVEHRRIIRKFLIPSLLDSGVRSKLNSLVRGSRLNR